MAVLDADVEGRRALGTERPVAGAAIGAVGMAVPEQVIENEPIAERLGVDGSWIVNRTGIERRHALVEGERLSDLAAAAGRIALERADVDPADLDLVLVGTTSRDEITPDAAPFVAAELGAHGAGAIDIGSACTAFVSAVAMARGQIETGGAERVLVIGADALAGYLDRDDKRTAGLFGDGAGAVVMCATEPPGHVGVPVLGADGSQVDLVYATREEGKLRMQGQETFKHAVKRLSDATERALELAGCDLDDIDLFVYHQANRRILRAVGERLDLPAERVVDCIANYGNTSAGSIPIALAEAEADGRLVDGRRVLMAAFGAGLTWGAVVLDWGLDGAKPPRAAAGDGSTP